MPARTDLRARYALVLALIGPLVVAALMVPLRSHVQNTDLALAMVVAVALLVLPGWRVAAVLAGLSAGAWLDFFLTRPYERFSIQRSSDVQTTVLLAVVGILVGEIATRRRQARRDSIAARDEVVSLYVIAEMLAAGRKTDDIVTSVAEQLHDVLFLENCRFDPTVFDSNSPLLDRAGELHYGRLNWSLAADGLPNRDVILPVESQGRRFGCYVLRGPALGVPLSQDRRLAAVALSDLAGSALNVGSAGYHVGQFSSPSSN
jgi:hypothetical protein